MMGGVGGGGGGGRGNTILTELPVLKVCSFPLIYCTLYDDLISR